jgi:hypothetical protein
MLLRRLLNMNLELYGKYPEFTGVDMTLKKLVETACFFSATFIIMPPMKLSLIAI